MKTKLQKTLSVIAATALLTIFTACQGANSSSVEPPKASLSIENGSTTIDPAEVSYIDIKFDKAMDTHYSGFVYYYDSNGDIINAGWINSYTYRMYLYLRYDQTFKIVFNDAAYSYSDYTKEKDYLRDIEGNFLKQFNVEFSTIPSTLEHPHTFEINIPSFSAKFTENQYAENCQNFRISIKELLNHEILKEGDTLKIKYKAYSAYNLKNVYAQLCDLSGAAKGWAILNEKPDEKDVLVIPELSATTDKDNPIYYEGECTFNIIKGMASSSLSIELWTDYDSSDENAEFVNISFANIE